MRAGGHVTSRPLLTTQHHLAPRLRNSRAIPQLPICVFMPSYRASLTFFETSIIQFVTLVVWRRDKKLWSRYSKPDYDTFDYIQLYNVSRAHIVTEIHSLHQKWSASNSGPQELGEMTQTGFNTRPIKRTASAPGRLTCFDSKHF